MQDNVMIIFMVGCVVFAVTVSSAFLVLIASDRPDGPDK
jgi:hypothetical protein